MPMIHTHTNVPVSRETALAIKAACGTAIRNLPGKTEEWLMVEVEGSCNLFFRGSDSPCAFAEVQIFGTASAEDYERMTAALTQILEKELAIHASRIYVKYEEVSHWGWNGSNF